MWIKICGNASLGDARLALDAGADALGFVFAASPRQVTVSEAAAIVSHLPAAVEKIGVFVDASLDEIYSTVRECGLTGVQLHFDAAPEAPAWLRKRLGQELRVVRVVHYGARAGKLLLARIAEYARDPHVDAVLADAKIATAAGGTGTTFDWAKARKKFAGVEGKPRWIVAGGLTPENVAEAIAVLKPWGVDVVSGVEAEPGRKDPVKLKAFVERARGAVRG
jgi:phosphoribosylanthranilate isomerase